MNELTSIKQALAFLLEEKIENEIELRSWYVGMRNEDKELAERMIKDYDDKIGRITALIKTLRGTE